MIDILIAPLLSLGNIGAIAILAVGIVMIYRASKVLNLAHGAMVMFPPYVVLLMTGQTLSNAASPTAQRVLACLIPAVTVGPLVAMLLEKRVPRRPRIIVGTVASVGALVLLVSLASAGMPMPVALVIGLAAGASLGYLVERVFVRALRAQGPTAQTVGTVAALGLVVAISARIFGTGAQTAVSVFPDNGINVSQSFIPYGQIFLFFIAMGLTFGLIALLQWTDLGLVMRGTAENRRAASLMGIDPDKITALTWILGGLMAGLSGILLASVTNLHPYVLSLQALPAFVAALLGGMASLVGAVVGAAVVGITFSVVPAIGPLQNIQGFPQLILAVAAVAIMATRGQKIVAGDVRSESIAAAAKGGAGRGLGPLERAKRPLTLIGILLFVAFPFLPFVKESLIANANIAARYTLIAASLVILIGWVGQISLGHAALVGVGGYATGWVAGGFGIPFPLSLPLAAIVSAGVAVLLGVVAVRVRGLFLAVATLIFSWMASEFLFRQEWFVKHFRIDAVVIGDGNGFPTFDFSNVRVLFFIVWAVVAVGLLAAANLRDSKTGRAFFAVQGSEMAAASLGIDVTRYKVMAFAVSGFLAGAAGNLMMTDARVLSPENFEFNYSLLFVAFAVVGGLRSLGGAVGAGILFAMLQELMLRVRVNDQLIFNGYLEVFSAALLAIVLLVYPGGLAGLGSSMATALGKRRRLMHVLMRIDRWMDLFLADVSWARMRIREKVRERVEAPALEALPMAVPSAPADAPVTANGNGDGGRRLADGALRAALAGTAGQRPALAPQREDRPQLVRAQNVTVRFGGLTAVNDVTLEVREGEIVGLIGPNGAGKTVTFNSIAGLVTPTEGRIILHGEDVTTSPVHERAKLGIARTFQVLQLFPALTIFENLMVATHLHNDTGMLSHVAAAPAAVDAERAARARVHEVVELLGLREVVDQYPGDLPFGTLRMVEVARALVTGLRFVMLDEAFSGLDDGETEQLVQSLLKIRELGITILLIEHDVKLVMSVSDYVYVLDRGTLISEGLPAHVQRDPAVIAAYLGRAPDDAEGSTEPHPEEVTV